MPNIVHVGAVACRAGVDATAENTAAAAVWIDRAAKDKVELLLFPELSLTGYATSGPAARPLDAGSPECAELASLAGKYGMTIAAGMVWQEPGGSRRLSHGLWLPSGELHIYHKTHLGQREKGEYTAGDDLPVFRLGKITVGLQLCLEQHFPEITQTLVLKGAQLILCPHATPRLTADARRESWQISLRARAYDNCVYLLAANQAGDNGQGCVYHGGAMVIGPLGQVLAEDFSGGEALVVACLDLDQAVDVRQTPEGMCRRFYPPERRPELYS